MVKARAPLRKMDERNGISREEWDELDIPEITEEQWKQALPVKEVLPAEFFESLADMQRQRGRPPVESPKKQVTLRLDADLVAHFKAGGKGWQSRINAALRKASGLDPA